MPPAKSETCPSKANLTDHLMQKYYQETFTLPQNTSKQNPTTH